jgi:hypothetical protein
MNAEKYCKTVWDAALNKEHRYLGNLSGGEEMRKISWLILIVFLILLVGFVGATAYIASPQARSMIDGSGLGPLIGGWGTGVLAGLTSNPFWVTYIGPNALLIFGGVTFIFGILTYRYVYEKGIRERAIRDAFDSRGSTGMVATSPSNTTPIAATSRPTTQQPVATPQPEVPASPPPEEDKK